MSQAERNFWYSGKNNDKNWEKIIKIIKTAPKNNYKLGEKI